MKANIKVHHGTNSFTMLDIHIEVPLKFNGPGALQSFLSVLRLGLSEEANPGELHGCHGSKFPMVEVLLPCPASNSASAKWAKCPECFKSLGL